MSSRRNQKDETKAQNIESRIAKLESQVRNLSTDNLNFLITNIRQMQSTMKSYEFNLSMVRRFLTQEKISEKFDAWFEAELKAMEDAKRGPQIPSPVPAPMASTEPEKAPGGVTDDGKIETIDRTKDSKKDN